MAHNLSNTFLMCDRCSSTVLLNIIISLRYVMAKLKSFRVPVINSWKYAGAWVSPNGTVTYSYFPKCELNAVLGIEDSSRGM